MKTIVLIIGLLFICFVLLLTGCVSGVPRKTVDRTIGDSIECLSKLETSTNLDEIHAEVKGIREDLEFTLQSNPAPELYQPHWLFHHTTNANQ